MNFVDNKTISKSKEETFTDQGKRELNVFLYIIYTIGAMLLGQVVFAIILGLSLGGDIEKALINPSDAFIIFSLLAEIFSIFTSILVARKFLHRSYFSLGLIKDNMGKDYLKGLGLSLLQISAIIVLALLLKSAQISLKPDLRLGYLFLFILGRMIQGFSEELICRSILMNGFTAFMPIKSAMIMNALIFSLLHLGNNSVSLIALVNLFLSGFMYSLIFYLKDSIWMAASAHTFWNMVQGNIFGMAVSGFKIFDTRLLSTNFVGNKFITGGGFGIEASLLCTFVEIVSIIYCYRLIKKRRKIKQ